MIQTLAWLIGERSEQLVETELLQGLRQADTTRLHKTQIQTVLTNPKESRQLTEINRLLKVEAKVLTHLDNNLHRAVADDRKNRHPMPE